MNTAPPLNGSRCRRYRTVWIAGYCFCWTALREPAADWRLGSSAFVSTVPDCDDGVNNWELGTTTGTILTTGR